MAQVALTLVAAALYAAAVVRVRRRRGSVDVLRTASFALGIALLLVAFLSPLDRLGEERYFSAHMAQHLLIGDLAPLFCVLGLNGPLLRPALALRPVRTLRALAHPFVALPLWAVDLCAWHLTPLYDAALDHDALHALQHTLFFVCGALLWASLLELLPGPRWFKLPHRLGYVGAMWIVSLTLSQIFLWSGRVYYARYGNDLNDQRIGGGIMLLEGSVVMLAVLVWLLWRELSPSPPMSTTSVAQPKSVAPQGVPSSGS
jgi:putative membrane protein